MRVLPPLDGAAAVVGGVEQLARQPLFHRILGAPAGAGNQPAYRQRLAAVGTHVDRFLALMHQAVHELGKEASPNLGSGRTSRLTAARRRDIASFPLAISGAWRRISTGAAAGP